MSVETLSRQNYEKDKPEISHEQTAKLGETVFDALAVDAEAATERSAEIGDSDIEEYTNSVTRLGDGQTVPDER